MTRRAVILLVGSLLATLWCSSARAEDVEPGIDVFLRKINAQHAIAALSPAEKARLEKALAVSNRRVSDGQIGKLLRNPIVWRPEGRQVLHSVIDALPEVANIPGAERAIDNASHPDATNFRGFGFELIAGAALMRYREPDGVRPRMVRLSADIRGIDGKLRESDGCAVFSGADQKQRLVSMKSVSSENALKRILHKAANQIALRNGSQDRTPGAQIQPAILMLGYSDPAVLRSAQRKDWAAVASRAGGKLLVLGVNQLSGEVTRLASVAPTLAPRIVDRPRPPGRPMPLSRRTVR